MGTQGSKRHRPADDLTNQPPTMNGGASDASADDDLENLDDEALAAANRFGLNLVKAQRKLARFRQLKGNLAEEVFEDYARRIAGIDGARQDLLTAWMQQVYQQLVRGSRDPVLELAARLFVLDLVEVIDLYDKWGS